VDSVERVELGVQAVVNNRVYLPRILLPVRWVQTMVADKNMRLVARVCNLSGAQLDFVSCETATLLAIPQGHAPAGF